MRTAVLVAAALAFSTPLIAQTRDTVVTTPRRAEAGRVVRLKEAQRVERESARAVEGVKERALEATTMRELRRMQTELPRMGRELAETRALMEREIAGQAIELDARTALLHEMRPSLEARGVMLNKVRPTIEARGVEFQKMQPMIESRMRELAPLMETRARIVGNEMRALEGMRGLEGMRSLSFRPRMGISVALDARETDNIGAYVNGVTPGGPADKAGIRAGDIIRKIGKISLTDREGTRRAEGESAPGLKLIETVGKLQAGKAVEVEYRRGSKDRTVKVTPDEADDVFAYTLRSDSMVWRRGVEGNMMMRVPGPLAHADSVRRTRAPSPTMAGNISGTTVFGTPAARSYMFTMGGPLGRFEMTALNPSLGSYFGATEGVLVINIPEQDNLGVMAGDVITAVDGRKVTTPSQLMRIMATYDKTEEMKLQVMRQKRSETISVKLP